MSDECMSRAIAILDTVFKTIESLGGSINSDLSVKIRGDIVRFCMVESQDQVKHEMTKQEAQALVKYNDDIKNHRWASKPQIRKYDKVYNGKLRIVFGARSYIRDNDSEKLEDRLGDILVVVVIVIHVWKCIFQKKQILWHIILFNQFYDISDCLK